MLEFFNPDSNNCWIDEGYLWFPIRALILRRLFYILKNRRILFHPAYTLSIPRFFCV